MQITRSVPIWIVAATATFTTVGCHHREYEARATSIRGMRFSAKSSFRNGNTDSLLVEVTAENRSGQQRLLTGGSCGNPYDGLTVFVISVAQPKRVWSTTAWQAARRARRATKPTVASNVPVLEDVCADIAFATGIKPGGSTPAGVAIVPVRDILGDSLPAGRYRIEALVNGSAWKAGRIPAGAVELSASAR